jgi:hypothetical protein
VEPPATGALAATPVFVNHRGFEPGFDVNVVFTTWRGTYAALRAASEWARRLNGRILLWYPQVVPRQFSTTAPPISVTFVERRLQSLAEVCCEDLNVVIRVCLCRDEQQCLRNGLDSESVVLVGGKKRWLPTHEQKLAVFLHSCGLRVLFIASNENSSAIAPSLEHSPT